MNEIVSDIKKANQLTTDRIKAALPYGAIGEIVKQTGYSRNTVQTVINNFENYSGPTKTLEKVSGAIIQILEKENQRKAKVTSALSKAISA